MCPNLDQHCPPGAGRFSNLLLQMGPLKYICIWRLHSNAVQCFPQGIESKPQSHFDRGWAFPIWWFKRTLCTFPMVFQAVESALRCCAQLTDTLRMYLWKYLTAFQEWCWGVRLPMRRSCGVPIAAVSSTRSVT